MTQASQNGTSTTPSAAGSGRLFGVPIGDLGWFTSIIMGTAAGFAAFFASTFCGIMGILIYNSVTHRAVDFTLSYRRIGLPVGLVVLVVALAYLGTVWVRRQIRRA
jgi:hypothetical protein